MKTAKTLGLALVWSGLVQCSFCAVLTNGDFEVPVVPTSTWGTTYSAPQYHLNDPPPEFGWQVGGIDVDLIGNNWQAAHGNQSLDLNGGNPGSIFQDFRFPATGRWHVQFELSGNPDTPGVRSVRVDLGPAGNLAALGTYTVDATVRSHANMMYETIVTPDIVVTDASAVYRLQFTSLTGGSCGPVLDNIQMVSGDSGPDCTPAPGGLVSWWRAEASGLDSAGSNHAAPLGDLLYASGEVGQSFVFNGTNSGLRVSSSASLNLGASDGMTIEMWVNPADAALQQNLIEWNDAAGLVGAHMTLSVPWGAGGPGSLWANLVDINNNHHQITSAQGVMVSGVFQHVALAYDKTTGVATLYRNGALVAQATIGPITPSTTSDVFVGFRPSGPSTGLVFRGAMDELSLYRRALSGSEIAAIYSAGTAGKCVHEVAPSFVSQPTNQTVTAGGTATFAVAASGTAPLTYQWRRDGQNIPEATAPFYTIIGVQLSDAGVYSVVVSNSVGWALSSNAVLSVSASNCTPSPPGLIGWWKAENSGADVIGGNDAYALPNIDFTPGVVGQAFVCHQSGGPAYSGVKIHDRPAYALTNSLSIECWVRPRADSYVIFYRGDRRAGLDPYRLDMEASHTVYFAITGADGQVAQVGAPLTLNEWWHVAATLDGKSGALSIYTNGILAERLVTAIRPFAELLTDQTPGVGIGNVNDGGPGGFSHDFPFVGDIDEVSLYNRALSGIEIAAIYSAGNSGKCIPALPPVVTSQPNDESVAVGGMATFTVGASGTWPLSYQWRFHDSDIAGATGSALVRNNVTLDQAGPYAVTVTNSYGAVTSTPAMLTVTVRAPFITVQPQDRSVAAGTSTSFSVSAGGSPPLSYQWTFNGTRLDGATNSTLTLATVRADQTGVYAVVITNTAGSVTSSNATLTVTLPPALVQVAPTAGVGGHPVVVPITLRANGAENALAFSLNFNPSMLVYSGITVGSGALGAALLINDSETTAGKVGAAIGLPAGATFNAGTQQVVLVTFNAVVLTNPTSTLLTFADSPLQRQLADAAGRPLPSTFAGASIALAASEFEGDVWPRPAGDRGFSISDWVTVGRYAARLDYPTNASEFQRSDCAPRAVLGDGQITVIDWVQAGRYAARLDPATVSGGPISEGGLNKLVVQNGDGARQVRVADAMLLQNQTGTVSINLEALGDENAVGFSLRFPTDKLTFKSASLGTAASGASLNVNAQHASAGQLGFVIALPSGSSFPAETCELVKISFQAPDFSGTAKVVLQDDPVVRQLATPAAESLAAGYLDGSVTVNPIPSLSIDRIGQSVVLSWPAWATAFELQTAVAPAGTSSEWTTVPITATVTNDVHTVLLPLGGSDQYYRLHQH